MSALRFISTGFDERPGRREHFVQSGLGEEPRRGVALARVVGAEQDVRPHPDLYPVAEGRPPTGMNVAEGLQRTEGPVPGEGTEGYDDQQAGEDPDLPREVGQAAVPLIREGLVVR